MAEELVSGRTLRVVREPLPLADLRSLPFNRHRRLCRAWLADGGDELVLATARGRWLFLWIADLERGVVRRSAYRTHFGPAAGMVGSVEDMARFSMAVDEHRFLSEASTETMFAPAVSSSGAVLPYAIGWFVTSHRGIELQWHYGWWDATSTLIVHEALPPS